MLSGEITVPACAFTIKENHGKNLPTVSACINSATEDLSNHVAMKCSSIFLFCVMLWSALFKVPCYMFWITLILIGKSKTRFEVIFLSVEHLIVLDRQTRVDNKKKLEVVARFCSTGCDLV